MLKAREVIAGWFDLETTGLDPLKCAITEFGMVLVDKGKKIDEILVYMRPDLDDKIEPKALEVTGKTLEEIKKYPPKKEGFEKIIAFFEKHKELMKQQEGKVYGAGHNICYYDLNFLYQWCKRKFKIDIFEKYFHLDKIDTVIIAREHMKWGAKKPKNNKLTTLSEYFEIAHDNAHTAMGDIKANIEVYNKMIELYKKQM